MGIHKKSDEDLTKREYEILTLYAENTSTKEIADVLNVCQGEKQITIVADINPNT